MSDWQEKKVREWRMRLNMACYHNRKIHIALRQIPDQPVCGYVKSPVPEDSYLVNFMVPTGQDSAIVVTFGIDDLLTVSRETTDSQNGEPEQDSRAQ